MNTWIKNIIVAMGLMSVVLLIFYLQNKPGIDYLVHGEKLEYKTFSSPTGKNQIVLLLRTVGGFHYTSSIYIVDRIDMKKIPSNNFISFPNGTGVFVKWINDNECIITCDNNPVYNDFSTTMYSVQLIVDEKVIRGLEKIDHVIRHDIPLATPTMSNN